MIAVEVCDVDLLAEKEKTIRQCEKLLAHWELLCPNGKDMKKDKNAFNVFICNAIHRYHLNKDGHSKQKMGFPNFPLQDVTDTSKDLSKLSSDIVILLLVFFENFSCSNIVFFCVLLSRFFACIQTLLFLCLFVCWFSFLVISIFQGS